MGWAAYLAAAVLLRVVSAGTAVALPLLAVERLGDVGLGGLLVAVSLAPSVVAAPFAGVALDRTRHPRALVAASGALTAVATAMAAGLGELPTALVAGALVTSGIVSPFFLGGLSSFAPDAFRDERTAYAADALTYNLGAVAGPAIAALLVAAGSARTALLVLAGGAAVGAVAAGAVRMRARPGTPRPVVRAIADGLGHLLRHRPLAVSTLAGTFSQLSSGALPIVAVPVALERAGTASAAGWIVTAFAVGALAGIGLTALPAVRRSPPARVMTAGFALTGSLTLATAPDLGMPALVGLTALAGACPAPAVASMLLLREQQSPPAVRSQVFTVAAGLRTTVAAAGAALAGLTAGAPPELLLALVGAVWLVSAALMLAFPWHARPLEATDHPEPSAV